MGSESGSSNEYLDRFKQYYKGIIKQANVLSKGEETNEENYLELSDGLPLDKSNLIPHQYIVKFKENIKLTEKVQITFEKSTGCELLQYIPEHSYLVYINNDQVKKVQAYPQVSHLIPLTPKMKVDPNLIRDMESGVFESCSVNTPGRKVGGAIVHMSVSLVPELSSQSARDVAGQIRSACENLTNVKYLRVVSNRKVMISLQICSRHDLVLVVDILAHHPAIHWIERFDMERDGFLPENYNARLIVQQGSSRASIGDGPFYQVGITGKNQTVAITDSGLDVDHCFFHDPAASVPVIQSSDSLIRTVLNAPQAVESNHRKIKAYVAFMDRKDGGHGHGSHTSGTLAGKCLYPDSPICKHNGIAQDSKLVFFDVGCDLDGGCQCDSFDACPCYMYPEGKCPGKNKLVTPIDLYSGLFEPQYKLGARISSNSLGGKIGNGYTQSTQEIDKFQYEHDDFLVVWSAGNSGAKGYMTLTGPSKQAKNSIIVGASVSGIESWKEALKYRNYTQRANILRKKLTKKYNCKCGVCNIKKCSAIDKLKSEEGCNAYMGDNCKFKHKLKIMKKKLNFNVSFACSQKCALKSLEDEKLKPFFNEQNLADFSSLGPTLDGRIKPDIVAPGYFLLSARSHFGSQEGKCSLSNKNDMKLQLKEMGGTSMSTPVVASAATLVRQYFTDGFYPYGKPSVNAEYTQPSAALIKAILIQSARGMKGLARKTDSFTHFNKKHRTIFEGHGLINLSNTLKLANNPQTPQDLFVIDRQEITTDIIHSYTFNVGDNATELAITLAWTDYPASPMASLALVNDLDLKLEYETNGEVQSIYGNHLYNNNQPDRLNNVEKILIPLPPVNTDLIVTVKGHNVPHGPQKYSLVINGKKITKASRIRRSLDVTDVSPSNIVNFFNWEFALIITSLATALLVSVAVNIGLCVYSCIKRKATYANL